MWTDVEGFGQNCPRQGRRLEVEHCNWGHRRSAAWWRATEAETVVIVLWCLRMGMTGGDDVDVPLGLSLFDRAALSTPGPRTAGRAVLVRLSAWNNTHKDRQPWCRYETRPCGPSLPFWPIIIQTLVWRQSGLKNPAWFWTWIHDRSSYVMTTMLQGPGLVVTQGDNFSGVLPVLLLWPTVKVMGGWISMGCCNYNF